MSECTVHRYKSGKSSDFNSHIEQPLKFYCIQNVAQYGH